MARKAPLVDLSFFARRGFVLGVAIGSLAMFSIMGLLLYFNLYAQSRAGLGLTALAAGASLLPFSAALLALALSLRRGGRIGLRNAITVGMALIVLASALIGVAVSGSGMVLSRSGSASWAPVWLCPTPWRRGWRCRRCRRAGGPGFGHGQCLHLSRRQRRRCRRRCRLRAGRLRRGADDDRCAGILGAILSRGIAETG